MKTILLSILIVAVSITAPAQSGRRVGTPASAPAAPVQPAVNAEPTPSTRKVLPAALMFVPESILERRIRAIDKSDNITFRLADFPGKVLVINFWASWCGPCRQEVPEYEKVRKEYAERDVEFIGLTDEDPAIASQRVSKFLRGVSFGFRLGWADREMARTLKNGRTMIPQTLVIDRSGNVVNHWIGYTPRASGDRLRAAIDNALR